VQAAVSHDVVAIDTEFCFNLDFRSELTADEKSKLNWLLTETFEPRGTRKTTYLISEPKNSKAFIVEVGPRLNFSTAWSTNAVGILHACGLNKVKRIERSRRYKVYSKVPLDDDVKTAFICKCPSFIINIIRA
jgi:phosphoribosylformylglycinamidine synthase